MLNRGSGVKKQRERKRKMRCRLNGQSSASMWSILAAVRQEEVISAKKSLMRVAVKQNNDVKFEIKIQTLLL